MGVLYIRVFLYKGFLHQAKVTHDMEASPESTGQALGELVGSLETLQRAEPADVGKMVAFICIFKGLDIGDMIHREGSAAAVFPLEGI